MERYALGVDVGGTKISGAVVLATGELRSEPVRLPSCARESKEHFEQQLFTTIEQAAVAAKIDWREIAGIGLGLPGPLDLAHGMILNPPNLTVLKNYPIRKILNERFNCPVYIDNDANCYALGEACFGAAKYSRLVIGLTLGTGFGCGAVIDREIYHGATDTAAEIWCTPYQDGVFEDYGAGRGIERFYLQRTGQRFHAHEVLRKAECGEAAALETWREYGFHLGRMLSFLVNFFDPDVIVLGGSIANAFSWFEAALMEELSAHICPMPRAYVRVLQSDLGERAAILGAAALVKL